jgi:hypothetical protein
MFFFASSRCSAGDPVSLGPEADGKPLVMRDGRNAIVNLIGQPRRLMSVKIDSRDRIRIKEDSREETLMEATMHEDTKQRMAVECLAVEC